MFSFVFLIIAILIGMRWYFTGGSDLLVMISVIEYIFTYLLAILCLLWKKCLFKSSACFLNQTDLLLFNCMNSLTILDVIVPYQICGLQIFLPSPKLPLHLLLLLACLFCCAEVFQFNIITPCMFLFLFVCFACVVIPNFVISSRILMVSSLTFKP